MSTCCASGTVRVGVAPSWVRGRPVLVFVGACVVVGTCVVVGAVVVVVVGACVVVVVGAVVVRSSWSAAG